MADGFYVSNFGDTEANRKKDEQSDPTNVYSKLADASNNRTSTTTSIPKIESAPSAPTIQKTVTSRTSSTSTSGTGSRDRGSTTGIVTAQPIADTAPPKDTSIVKAQPISTSTVQAQPISTSFGVTTDGERFSVDIKNGISYISGTNERPPIGSTIETAGGIFKMTSSGGVAVSEHNVGAVSEVDRGTIQSETDEGQNVIFGDELHITGMGAIRGADSQTYTGKGFAYVDDYGFVHVVTNYQTAREYSGDGNVYVYDGQFAGGYAVTPEGERARIALPGSKEYGNTLEKGEVSPMAPGTLTSLSGQPPEGMVGVISNGQEVFLPMSQVLQQQGQPQAGQAPLEIPGISLTGGEQPSNLPPEIGSLLSGGTLTSDDLQQRIDERLEQQESIGQLLRESFGELREHAKKTIKSRLEKAVIAQEEAIEGAEKESKEARTQSDIETQKHLRRMREAGAARGDVTGEQRVAETQLLREALRESGRIKGRETEFKNIIASNIAQLKSAASSEEASMLFQIEQEETKAIINQMERIGAIKKEERQDYLAELQATVNIHNAVLSRESTKIAQEAGRIANQINQLKLEGLPAELEANMRRTEAEIQKLQKVLDGDDEMTAIEVQQLAKAKLDVQRSQSLVDVAKLDAQKRAVGESAVIDFFSAVEGGVPIANIKAYLSANRGNLELLGLYDDFLSVVNAMELQEIYPSGMPGIYNR